MISTAAAVLGSAVIGGVASSVNNSKSIKSAERTAAAANAANAALAKLKAMGGSSTALDPRLIALLDTNTVLVNTVPAGTPFTSRTGMVMVAASPAAMSAPNSSESLASARSGWKEIGPANVTLTGNVSEWTNDAYASFADAAPASVSPASTASAAHSPTRWFHCLRPKS